MSYPFLNRARTTVLVVAAVLAIADRPVLAEPDSLKVLLDKPECKRWREVSQVTLERLRKAQATREAMDLKLVEQAFTFMDYCAEQMELKIKQLAQDCALKPKINPGTVALPIPCTPKVVFAGRLGGEEAVQRAVRTYAALTAYYKQALASPERAAELKNWPNLTQAANSAAGDLRAIIDKKFGQGAFQRYRSIADKPEKSRTEDEQKTFAAMRPWLEPP